MKISVDSQNIMASLQSMQSSGSGSAGSGKFDSIMEEIQKGDLSEEKIRDFTSNSSGLSNEQYLVLQREMQKQNELFTTLSNIMKNRHQTIQNTIQNIK